ncbi:hypothetical protein AJ80_04664 [Polytolypa hystricis UAMH7299]|uniref:Large ribosomal subunit protein uL29m n=1 Tax=Polytolypa hystricis (strain UAMH7299) TaxID=1447883 RepID=A0A2B7Y9V8_POLH7|nr:hypothetical protein AJ80_04664 [Polytolypa hystricis UAMH7299]
MHSRSISRLLSQHGGSPLADLPPIFLAPSLQFPLIHNLSQCSRFSTTSPGLARHRKDDLSRQRGVSAIHRTGPRFRLSVHKYPLPTPAPDPKVLREPSSKHGLWGFFGEDRQAVMTPEDEYAHGRSWTIDELRNKSWEDLHCLWWVCAKERNKIATSQTERLRLKAGYGDFESQNRDKTVFKTQQAIKMVLRERWHAWSDARELFSNGYRPTPEEEVMEDEFQEGTNGEAQTSDAGDASPQQTEKPAHST